MNDDIRRKLSAYLDGALPDGETRALEQEIAQSPELLRELEELKAVSRLVKDLPRERLPAGFMQRLERRRAAQDAPESRDWVFLSPAYRPLVAALSGIIVAVAVWDRFGERPPVVLPYDAVAVKSAADAPPAQFDVSAKVSGAGSAAREADAGLAEASAPEFHPPAVEVPEDAKRAGIVARRERVRAKGRPIEEAPADMAAGLGGAYGFAAQEAAPAAPSSVAAARGAASARPMSEEERSARNEELHQALEREKKRLGIAALVARDEAAERARRVLAASGRPQAAAVASGTPRLLGADRAASGLAAPLRDDAAYQAAWSSLLLPGQPPPMDFKTEMIVLLPEPGAVDSALESAGELIVRWAPAPGSPRDRLRPVPFSRLPVRLMRRPAPAP